jgi:NADH dehydrogenase (ubiquinone) Fe-S protein 1
MHALRERMYEIAPSLSRYDIIEPASLGAVGLKVVGDTNKGSKSTGGPLTKVIEDFYLTDVISRRYLSSQTLLIQFSHDG